MKFKPRCDVSEEGRNPFTILGIAARPLNRSEIKLDLVIIKKKERKVYMITTVIYKCKAVNFEVAWQSEPLSYSCSKAWQV